MSLHAATIALGWRAVSTLLTPVVALMAAVWQEFLSRRDRRLLAAMDDQGLSDIGLCRGQIFDAVRSGRVPAWV